MNTQKCISLLLLFSGLLFGSLQAQLGPVDTMTTGNGNTFFDYGNDWYRNNQTYFKLKVWEDGIYRVSLGDLQAANVNLSGMMPDNIHLIYRGEEVPLFVKKDGSGSLEYFEFYGKRHDGEIDKQLYRDPYTHRPDPEQQPNEHYSLFSDTSTYFVTWNNTPGLRFAEAQSGNYATLSPESHFRYQALQWVVSPNFFRGGGSDNNSFILLNSDYITGEGYRGFDVFDGDRRQIRLETPKYAASGNPNRVEIRSMGINSTNHYMQVALTSTVNIVHLDTFSGISMARQIFLDSTPLPNATRIFIWALMPNPTESNKIVVNWASIDYDRLFDADGENFLKIHEWEDADSARFSFANVDMDSLAYVYDLTGLRRIEGVMAGTKAEFVVPGSPDPRKMILASDRNIKTPQIEPLTSLANLSNRQNSADFIIISHRKLQSAAEKYKLYRDTCTVNPHKARVVYVDQIYDEFGYGTVTPLAIKRFCKYALDNWTTRPKMFFLFGKGMYRTRAVSQNLVPTWGFPATDFEYVSNFYPQKPNYIPLASVGRVNVESNQEAEEYLKKVNEYEHMPYAAWMKEAVFLGGGKNFNEQTAIINALVDKYKPLLENSEAAGKVYYFAKKGNGTETNSTLSSEDRINKGTGLIHFFGHSGANIFDVDILDASLYTNEGKYPFMIAAGCYGGDFTESIKSFGERFILEPGKGCIGYLANSTSGFLSQLSEYGTQWYESAFLDNYHAPIGEVIREGITDYLAPGGQQSTSIFLINHSRQMNLQGDPALVLRFPTRPDLRIQAKDVVFQPATLSAQDNEFGMTMLVENQGASFVDSFQVRIRQRSPIGQEVEFPLISRPPTGGTDTISVTLPNNFGNLFAGLNEFEIFVDPADSLTEYFEDNNLIIKRQLIQSNTPAILMPPKYAVVPDPQVTLSAGTYVVTTQGNLEFEFQIDTVPDFNSPRFRSSGPVTGVATHAEWQVPFSLSEGQVYYWRVRLTQTNPPAWSESSFRYKSGKEGWSQSQMYQFTEDQHVGVTLDQLDWEWAFDIFSQEMRATTNNRGFPGYFFGPFSSNLWDPGPSTHGVVYTSIDQHTLEVDVQGILQKDWRWIPVPQALPDLVNAIQSTPTGDYFLLCSFYNPEMENWEDQYIRALEQIGCEYAQMRAVKNGQYFLILGRKGDAPGTAQVVTDYNLVLNDGSRLWEIRTQLSASYTDGSVISTDIGPATSWQDVTLDWSSLDLFPQEDVLVSVLGIRTDNTVDTLMTALPLGNHLLNGIDAAVYPSLRLVGGLSDTKNYTAPQLDEWEVLYGVAPDAIIDPITNAVLPPDTIDEGQVVNLNVQARNITDTDMDSLLVRYSIERQDRSILVLGYQRYAPVPGKTAIDIPYELNTVGKRLGGNITLTIELNPDNDQVEQYAFNNIFRFPFYVKTDGVGPLLDVTFDGKHLMDGDIISPTPEIQIQISDENEYLPISVSDSTFQIWFGRGRATDLLPMIPIEGNANIEPVPGKNGNKSSLIFRPGLLEDGEYSLKVQGKDAKGNEAGSSEYIIHFNVVNEKAISQVMNYPNPFSSNTRFVYTLTGNELPYRFEIQIYTISGKLIRVLDLLAAGDVHFGYNVSDTYWDGTDDFGDAVANGVYIYKAVIKFRDRSDHKIRDEGIDDFFTNGYGKMYLMR